MSHYAGRAADGFGLARVVWIVAVVVALYLIGKSCVTGMTARGLRPPPFDRQFQPVPMQYDWKVADLDGTELDARETRGKVTFINIWATWCPPCRAEMPSIQALYDRMSPEGVVFILLSQESAETQKKFLSGKGLKLPAYVLPNRQPAILRTEAIPTTLIVSPDGQVVFRHRGAARWDDESTVQFLRRLAGSPPVHEMSQTRPPAGGGQASMNSPR